jgi:hypothetical protein
MPEPTDPPIIVSGGSVTLEFDATQLPPNGSGKHFNANKKITRVVVTGDGISFDESIPNGKVTVTIHYGNGTT